MIASSLGDTVFFEGSRRVGLAPALTISMTYPLMAALFAAAFLGEPMTPRLLVGSVLTLGGLTMIVTSRGEVAHDSRQWWLGFGCAVLAALTWGCRDHAQGAAARDGRDHGAGAPDADLGCCFFATPWARGAASRIARSNPSVLWRLAVLCLLTTVSTTMFAAA